MAVLLVLYEWKDIIQLPSPENVESNEELSRYQDQEGCDTEIFCS
jgi:hypothetical protein